MKASFVLAVIAVLFLAACAPRLAVPPTPPGAVPAPVIPPETQEQIQTTPEGLKYLVHPDKIVGVLPPDAIPSVDKPKFTTAAEADRWLFEDDIVIGLFWKGEARAYPHRIMNWHEIVNDVIQDDALLITYCPLCATGIGFHRALDGAVLEFGTSGKLYNSELVMYDRNTASLWTQSGARAVVGELTGARLRPIFLDNVEWRDWKKEHPDTVVLSRDTGHLRDYNADPYGGYGTSAQVWFPVENVDSRLFPKELVYGIVRDGAAKAYPENVLRGEPIINDVVGGLQVVVARRTTGLVRAYNREVAGATLTFTFDEDENLRAGDTTWDFEGNGLDGPLKMHTLEPVVPERIFWFAWSAFNPGGEIYGANNNEVN